MKAGWLNVYSTFEENATQPLAFEEQLVGCYHDCYSTYEVVKDQLLITGSNDCGTNTVHRASIFEGLVKYMPEEITHFTK